MQMRFVPCVGLMLVLTFAASMVPVQAGDPDPAVQKKFAKLLAAIKAGDLDGFVADGTEAVKKGATQQVVDGLKKDLGTRLEKGYKSSYLCSLNQAGHQVHLWKMTFKDDGDDVVIRVAFKDGKMAGFFLQ